MYSSNNKANLPKEIQNLRTEIAFRLAEMGFNLVPANGKKTCRKWKQYQTEQVTLQQLSLWLKEGRFDNLVLLTGETPWSETNPGIVVLDADDEEALVAYLEARKELKE